MDEITRLKVSVDLTRRDLGLEENALREMDITSFERFHEWLSHRIETLIDTDFSGLMQALYRIDVSETEVKRILALSTVEEISSTLAKAIIDREMEKVKTRQQYR